VPIEVVLIPYGLGTKELRDGKCIAEFFVQEFDVSYGLYDFGNGAD